MDDQARAYRKEGAQRVFNAVFIGSVPLALGAGFLAGALLAFCITYYCTLAFWATVTA